METFKVGQRVKVLTKNANASVAFIGETYFSDGVWIGVVFDDPIGKHDGVVDDNRYFNCPADHGLFVRPSQIKCIHESVDSFVENNSHQSQMRTSPKQKLVPQNCDGRTRLQQNCTEPHTTKERFFTLLERKLTQENKELQLKVRRMDESLKNVRQKHSKEVSELKEKLKNSDDSARNIKQQKITIGKENKELKDRIKWLEDALKDVEQKRLKLLEEIQDLRMELDNRKKQVKVQKCHIKLLKMRQNNYNWKSDSSGNNYLNHKICGKTTSRDFVSGKAEDDPKLLVDEIDLESAKVLSKMQNVAELEEQNRIMIEGLIELRDFLKTKTGTCTSQEQLGKRGSMPGCNRKSLAFFVPDNSEPPVTEQHDHQILDFETSKAHLEKYRNILKELTMYTKLVTDNRKSNETKPEKCFGDNFPAPLQPSETTIPCLSRGILSSPTSELQFKVGENRFRPFVSEDIEPIQRCKNLNSNRVQDCLQVSSHNCSRRDAFQEDNESNQSAKGLNSNRMQKFLQVNSHNQSSGESSKKHQQLRRQRQIMTCKTDEVEVLDPLEELKQLMTVVLSKTDDKIQCKSNANRSLMKHGRLVNEIPNPNFTSGTRANRGSDPIPKFSFSFTPQQIEVAIQSIGDNPLASSKKDRAHQRMPFTFQRP